MGSRSRQRQSCFMCCVREAVSDRFKRYATRYGNRFFCKSCKKFAFSHFGARESKPKSGG